LPFDVVMVPLPDQEPDMAVNGLLKACTGPGAAARPRSIATDAADRLDLMRRARGLLVEIMVATPGMDFLMGSRNTLKKVHTAWDLLVNRGLWGPHRIRTRH
jgi:hypothetical protein